MTKVLRRRKGKPRRKRPDDPVIEAVLERISILTRREEELHRLLKRLVKTESLELEEGVSLERLAIRLTEALEGVRSYSARAKLVSDWLLEQEEVVDLYVDDDEMLRLMQND